MALVLSLMLFVVGCGKDGGKEMAGGMDVQSLIAKDAQGFFVIDMKAFAGSGLYEELEKDGEFVTKFEDFKQKTGLDPKKDLDSAVLVMFEAPSSPGGDAPGYFIASGNFDEAKIKAALDAEEKVEVTEKDIEGYSTLAVMDNEKGQEMYLHFADANTLFFAPTSEHLVKGLHVKEGKVENLTANAEMSALYDKCDKSQMFWGLFNVPKTGQSAQQMGMMPGMSSLKSVYFGGTYKGEELSVMANLFTDSADSSKQMATSLTGMLSMVKGMAAEEPKAGEIFDKIQINQDGESVVITFTMTKEEMDTLKQMGGGGMR